MDELVETKFNLKDNDVEILNRKAWDLAARAIIIAKRLKEQDEQAAATVGFYILQSLTELKEKTDVSWQLMNRPYTGALLLFGIYLFDENKQKIEKYLAKFSEKELNLAHTLIEELTKDDEAGELVDFNKLKQHR